MDEKEVPLKTDWRPSRVAFLDFETQSADKLLTVKKYANHPSTRVVCATMKVDGKHIEWRHGQPCPPEYANVAKERVLVAHNAPFDREIWDKFVGADAVWFDTLPLARSVGLPGGLNDACKALFGAEKDPIGEKLISLVSKVKMVGGQPQYYAGNEFIWQQFLDYCKKDVDLLEMLYASVKGVNVEPSVLTVDRTVNDRGIPVCTPLLEHLADLDSWNKGRAAEDFAHTGVNAKSPKQVKEWLLGLGFKVASSGRQELEDLVSDPAKYYVGDPDNIGCSTREVEHALVSMGELTKVGGSKIRTALELTMDGRIYDQYVYYGAHTGRWSARQLQPHNFPGQLESIDIHSLLTDGPVDPDRCIEFADKSTAEMRKTNPTAMCYVSHVINSLLRTCVRAPSLAVFDYGAVEARGVAWVCGEEKLLKAFRDPSRDVYGEFAERIYGKRVTKDSHERFIAKQIVLGCGYGMSGGGFKKAFDTLLGETWGAALSKSMELPEETAKQFVKLYRNEYAAIPRTWYGLDEAVMAAIRGSPRSFAKCNFYMVGSSLAIELPSGRKIMYRNARIELRPPMWNPNTLMQTVVFTHPFGYEGTLYGGRTLENIVQAHCRDLLAYSTVSMDEEGLNPCFHVHDEVGCETERAERVAEIMSAPPPWSAGFPVLVEGYQGKYWTKQYKNSGFKSIRALDGRVL